MEFSSRTLPRGGQKNPVQSLWDKVCHNCARNCRLVVSKEVKCCQNVVITLFPYIISGYKYNTFGEILYTVNPKYREKDALFLEIIKVPFCFVHWHCPTCSGICCLRRALSFRGRHILVFDNNITRVCLPKPAKKSQHTILAIYS